MSKYNSLNFVLAASTLLSPFAPVAAFADQVRDIVVTAQKREEKLQEVPIAITALSSAQLETKGVATITDLNSLAPNLRVSTGAAGPNDTLISLRGFQAAEALLGNDSPIGFYIDGVINARIAGAITDLVELERIEVLRGPQGTLYGRNTTGGAINLITKKPSKDFHVTQKFGVQTYDGFTSRTTVDTGELGDTGLSSTLSFLYKKIGGYDDNLAQPDKKDPGSQNTRAGRIAINFDRGGNFRANYAYIHSASENGRLINQLTAVSPTFAESALVLPIVSGKRRDEVNNPTHGTDDAILNAHNLTLEYDLSENIVLKSISGYRRYQNTSLGNEFGEATTYLDLGTFAVTTAIPFSASNEKVHEQWSEELQLNGAVGEKVPGGPRVTYTAGAYYFAEQGSEINPQTGIFPVGFVPIPGFPGGGVSGGAAFGGVLNYNASTESWAVFGQSSFTPNILNDQLRLTAGLRYSEDEKSQNLLSAAGLAAPRSAEAKFNATTWLVKAQYFLTDDINGYVSYSRGFKAGGFNTRSVNLEPFKPEIVKSLEAGVKANWFDRRLQTNVAAFFNKADDLQVSQFVAGAGGATTVVTNAGQAEYPGVEFEIIAKPVEGLTLDWSMGFVNPEYKEYGTGYLGNRALPFDPVTNPIIPFDAKNVAAFGYVPQTTGNAGIQYDSKPIPAMGGGKLQARVEAVWQSKQRFLPAITYPDGFEDNPLIRFTDADAQTVVNARLALNGVSAGALGTVDFALWGKNLGDEEYIVSGIDFGSLGTSVVNFGAPLTAGFDVTFRY